MTGWDKAVGQLKNKAARFGLLYDNVVQSGQKIGDNVALENVALDNEREVLISRGNTVKFTIDTLTRGIDNAVGMSNFVFNGFNSGTINIGALGAIPLIPIAVLGSASAAMTYWINDAVQYLDKVNRIDDLQRKGYPAAKAYSMVYGNGRFSKILPWAVGGVVSLLVVRHIIGKGKL